VVQVLVLHTYDRGTSGPAKIVGGSGTLTLVSVTSTQIYFQVSNYSGTPSVPKMQVLETFYSKR
jgi:hypothetical protein